LGKGCPIRIGLAATRAGAVRTKRAAERAPADVLPAESSARRAAFTEENSIPRSCGFKSLRHKAFDVKSRARVVAAAVGAVVRADETDDAVRRPVARGEARRV
jgi:hypothetical protein